MITVRRYSSTVPGTPFRIVYGLDSLSAFCWVAPKTPNASGAGPWFADALQAAAIAAGSLPAVNIKGPASTLASFAWFNAGTAGEDCETFRTNYGGTIAQSIATKVAAFKPDLFIPFLGVNCVQHSVSDGNCTTNHAAILAQTQAQCPGCQIAVPGPLCIQENWPRGANPFDTQLDAKDTIIRTTAQAAGAEYIDLRTPMFAFEAANNPGHLAILGPLTNPDASAVHPNDVGRAFLASVMLSHFQFA